MSDSYIVAISPESLKTIRTALTVYKNLTMARISSASLPKDRMLAIDIFEEVGDAQEELETIERIVGEE